METPEWIVKQNDFCADCVKYPNLFEKWYSYRKILTKSISGLGYTFPVCCYYKDGYSRSRGRYADYKLYCNYTRIKEYKDCSTSFPVDYYDSVISIINIIRKKYNNLQVFLPVNSTKLSWKKFSLFHFNYLFDFFDKNEIKYHTGSINLNIDPSSLYILIFEAISNNTSLEKNIYTVISELKDYKPGISHLSFSSEVSKSGSPIH